MAMTIAVTRNTPNRFNGFLASCMHEIAPGVYAAPRMKKSVRERVWNVMMEWAELLPQDGGVVLFWKSRNAPSGLGIRMIGWPKKEMVDHEGLWLTMRDLTAAHDIDELHALAAHDEPPSDGDDPTLGYLRDE
jgi:CRISPR-associated protein Cas2